MGCDTIVDSQTGGGSTTSFANFNSTEWIATKFVASETATICQIEFWMQVNTGSPAQNPTARIYSHDSGNDEPDVIIGTASDTLDLTGMGTGYQTFVNVSASIVASTTYWLMIEAEGEFDGSHYASITYETSINSTHGVMRDDDGLGTWAEVSATGQIKFRIYKDSGAVGALLKLIQSKRRFEPAIFQ